MAALRCAPSEDPADQAAGAAAWAPAQRLRRRAAASDDASEADEAAPAAQRCHLSPQDPAEQAACWRSDGVTLDAGGRPQARWARLRTGLDSGDQSPAPSRRQ